MDQTGSPPGFRRAMGPKGRIVYVPQKHIRELHYSLLSVMGDISFPSQNDCVRPHLKNRFLLKIDLRKAYDHVSRERLEKVLDIPLDGAWKHFFHNENGGLIQGAPASNALFELYCAHYLDRMLALYCKNRGLAYTRYYDDILISKRKNVTDKEKEEIRTLILSTGFIINGQKGAYVDNRYIPLEFVGIRILNGKCMPTKKFYHKKAQKPLHKKNVRNGVKAWEDLVRRLNHPLPK